MTMINHLRAKIAANQFEFSKHALDQSILRGISVQELREAIILKAGTNFAFAQRDSAD